MKTLFTVIGLIVGLLATLFAADQGVKFVRENNKKYVTLEKREGK